MADNLKSSQPATLSAQVSKVAIDTKGVLKLEVGVPLHIALRHAEALLAIYNQNLEIILPPSP